MKKLGVLLVMAMFLAGCATLTVSKLTAKNRMSLVHLSAGMSKQEVLAIMGTGISAYTCEDAVSKACREVTINNPYRTEMTESSGKASEVYYYLTDLKNKNCEVEEDELTPLAFENGKLIGWGKNFHPAQPVDVKAEATGAAEKEQVGPKSEPEQKA